MTSLAVLFWMSAVSLGAWASGPGGPIRDIAHLSAQLLVLSAVMAQAGHVETGAPTRGRRPLQVLALVAFVANLAVHHASLIGLL